MARPGLSPASVTEAAADLVDELGFAQLSMGLVAERLGVKTPSLYKHVGSQAELARRIAVLGATQFGEAIRDATQGRAGGDALAAAAQAMRKFVIDHPGRYEAANTARATGPEDPFLAVSDRAMGSLGAVLRGYHLDPGQETHALRTLRSMLHGFAVLEAAGGFQLGTDVDASFAWMLASFDRGLRAAADST